MNKNILRWAIFDMGGNVYQMIVMTLSILPAIYLTLDTELIAEKNYLHGNKILSGSIMFINITVALLSPFFGTYVDTTKNLKRKILKLTIANIIFMALVSLAIFFNTQFLLIVFFIIGEICFQMTRIIYVAMIPLIEEKMDKRGRIIAIGVMFSYIGSFIAIGLSIISKYIFGEFNLDYNEFSIGYIPYLILFGSFIYLITSLPMLRLNVVEPKGTELRFDDLNQVLNDNRAILNRFFKNTSFRYFMVIVFFMSFYSTILFVFLVQVVNVGFGFSNPTEIISIMIGVSIISAILSAQFIGKLVDRFGISFSMGIVIQLFSITYLAGYFVKDQNMILIYLIGIPFGPALAGTIITQRKFILKISDPENVGNNIGMLTSLIRLYTAISPFIWTFLLYLLVKYQYSYSIAIQKAMLIVAMTGIIPSIITILLYKELNIDVDTIKL